jgi:nucleotide-binding universal stress UspA family protein
MLTERDALRAGASTVPELRRYDWDAALLDLEVGDAMVRDPALLDPDTPLAVAARRAREEGIEAFVVVESGELVGVVTASDLLAVLQGLLERDGTPALGTILVATSLRPGPSPTMAEAIRLADVTGASISALHVLPRMPRLSPAEGATADTVVWAERARRQIASEALAAMSRLGHGHQVRCDVSEGPAAREIVRRATDLGVDLIVLGCSARRAVARLFCATIADEVARVSPCPVLAVPRWAR